MKYELLAIMAAILCSHQDVKTAVDLAEQILKEIETRVGEGKMTV